MTVSVTDYPHHSRDFDLEAHIAELPVCSMDSVTNRKLKSRKRSHDSASSATDGLSPLETSYDQKVADSSQQLTGSQKRKARRRTITHLVPQSATSQIKGE